MFTGLVEGTGRVISVEEDGMAQLAINVGNLAVGIGMGDSVSVNGACLTVNEMEGDILVF